MENNLTWEKVLLACNRNAELLQLVEASFDFNMISIRRMKKKYLNNTTINLTTYYNASWSSLLGTVEVGRQ